jgi:hypothetical protein
MTKRSLIALFMFLIGLTQISAQTSSVAGWSVVALGNDRNHLPKINGNAFATLIINNEQLVFSLWETETQQSLGPSILLENLYFDQTVAEGNSFLGMKSIVKVLGEQYKNGILYLSLSKSDEGNDIIHFDFGREQLYIVGYLLDEEMASRITKLAGIGTVLKNGGKPKMPFSKMLDD